ncbi:MAG: hypothetical protein ABTD50_08915 [Polyangiaceae bacterium]|jgi:hypothetical protein
MMRREFVVALAAMLYACGGASSEVGVGARTSGQDSKDPEFSAYAAAHRIRTLDSPEETSPAASDDVRLERVLKDRPIQLDGVLTEWPPLVQAKTQGPGSTKSVLKVALQYDDAHLYVGADVTDAQFVAGKDHVSLVLAVPVPGGGYAPYELGLYPGTPGETEGSVRVGGRGVAQGSKIVEAPTAGGYSFEAVVPWSAMPDARVTRVGIHGILAYVDGDGTVSTGPGDARHPASMPWIPSESELSMIEQLLAPKGLAHRPPEFEIVADLTGAGARERIAVYENYLTICGDAFLGGTGFFYRELGGEIVKLEVRDVTGRGKGRDIVVRRRQTGGDETRETLEVLTAPSANEEPRVVFAHEIGIRQSDKHIDNAVRMAKGIIEVSVEPSIGPAAPAYDGAIAADVEPLLLPGGAVRAQAYRFDGTRFAKVKEVAQREASTPENVDPPAAHATHPPEPPTPKVARGGDLSSQLLEQFRRDRGLRPGSAPKVDLRVQVAGDPRPERVVLIGRDIVVFGPGFREGMGYAYVTLQPFATEADIRDLSARDLTGDGAADLVVRGVRRAEVDGEAVAVELMLVYQVKQDSIERIFGIETARERTGKRLQGLVQFVPRAGGHAFDIVAVPGRATGGWTEKTYPWAEQSPGAGSLEPLVLPWSSRRVQRYSWNGSQFAPAGG